MKASINRRCHCKDSDGKELGAGCPDLERPKHGEWELRARITTSAGIKPYRRGGFATRKKAEEHRTRATELLALARGDAADAARVGDLVVKVSRGAELPAVEDVRRRLGLRGALDRSMTVAEWLEQWYGGKRKLRPSTARSYRQHLDHYLLPLLGHLPLDRLTPEHIADLFDLIEEWNSEIRAAREAGRLPVLDLDTRTRAGVVGVATQRRIFATLRTALNAALKMPRRIDYNPCDAVEMVAEYREPANTWAPEHVVAFLDHCEEKKDRLAVLFRLVLLHGLRRGEAVGARRSRFDHRLRDLTIVRPLLQLGGRIVEGQPKTRAGERTVILDVDTADMLKRECLARRAEKLECGEAYTDNDLIFCWGDGSPYGPDYVSRRWRELVVEAGLPKIKLHEGRHTAASLRLEAGVDIKVVSEGLGHSNTVITRDLYSHVRRVLHEQANAAVLRLLPERKGRHAG
jgi:integrase